MVYRSERFPVDEMSDLEQVFRAIDEIEASGLAVQDEVMAGTSYRRQLHKDTIAAGINVNYLLQTTFTGPKMVAARTFVESAARILTTMDLPGDVILDEGAINGFDITSPEYAFGSTGNTDTDITMLYPPWIKASWSQNGRSGLFLCGIHAPQPKRLLDEYNYNWSPQRMRQGMVVFENMPELT